MFISPASADFRRMQTYENFVQLECEVDHWARSKGLL